MLFSYFSLSSLKKEKAGRGTLSEFAVDYLEWDCRRESAGTSDTVRREVRQEYGVCWLLMLYEKIPTLRF